METETSSPAKTIIMGSTKATDAAEAIRRATALVAEHGTAVVPLGIDTADHEEIKPALNQLGIHCARMGTHATRTLLASREPLRLLFRNLSPSVRACLTRQARLRLFLVPGPGDRFVTLPYVDSQDWLDLLSRVICDLGSESRFLRLHREATESIAVILTSSPAFEAWRNASYPANRPVGAKGSAGLGKRRNIYKPHNQGRHLVSIDIESANFQVLRNAGLIEESSWEALVARPDVSPCASASEYMARAKNLRMVALSGKALRPGLQRAIYSNVIMDALDEVIEHGVFDKKDLLAWGHDEIVFCAADEHDALAKAARCADLLAHAMPRWRLKCEAHWLDALAPPLQPGYLRVRLADVKKAFKCVPPERLQASVGAWACMPDPSVTTPWPDTLCILFPDGAEMARCDRATQAILREPAGMTREQITDHLVRSGVRSAVRARELCDHLVEQRGGHLLVEQDADRVVAVWRAYDSIESYRTQAWPDTTLLPNGAILVDTAEACTKAVQALVQHHAVALVCEGVDQDGVDLSLVRVSTGTGITYLFDMLSPEAGRFMDSAAGGLRLVLESPDVSKVVHDSRRALGVLARHYDCTVRGLFDTQAAHAVAAGNADGPFKVSRGEVLARWAGPEPEDNTDGDVVKKVTARDRWSWHRRPLSEHFVRYAAADMDRLLDAYHAQRAALDAEQWAHVCAVSAERAADAALPPEPRPQTKAQ